MRERDLRSGGVAGLILLVVVVVLAIRACRSTAGAQEQGSDAVAA